MTVESAAAAAASESNYYQLLVRIYTGRKFPAPEDGAKAVALECRFNQETLSTDPTPLISSPTFNTELVWEFGADRYKALSAKDGNTIRLRCVNADDVGRTGATLLGFVLLDLRQGLMAGGGKDEWHPLRGARKPPPEVRIMFKISVKALAPAPSPPPPLEPAKPPPTSETPPRASAKKQPSAPRPPPPTKEEAIDMVLAAASEHGAETSEMRSFALSVDLRTVRSAESVGSTVFLRYLL